MSSPTEVGRAAEAVAAAWLERHGFGVLDRNWRTRWCELDIVAGRGEHIHFVEVKYRRRPDFGTGIEHVTPAKIARLQRAALMWLKAHGCCDANYQIDVMAVGGTMSAADITYISSAVVG